MTQAVQSVRPGGVVGVVGVPHGIELPVSQLFFRNVGVKGGPASVPQYLPELLDKVLTRAIDPGKVFDLELPLERAADAYAAMDERRAIKVLLRP
jgi:threonine dehydrogenase-like Zn-dependent dehydrogenase